MKYIIFCDRDDTSLSHYQVKGARHGVRRYQNLDGSLTPLGREHYGVGEPRKKSNKEDVSEAERSERELLATTKTKPLSEDEQKNAMDRLGPPYPLNSKMLAEKLYSEAKIREPGITKDVTAAIKNAGGSAYGLEHRLKTPESIQRKIDTDSEEKSISVSNAAMGMKDLVRYTMLSKDDSFVGAYENFKTSMRDKGYTEKRCRNYFELYKEGKAKHKSVQSVFETADGYLFEVQFQTPSSQAAKNKKIPIYEERRKSGLSKSRQLELEKQMEQLADEVAEPKNISRIKSH